MGVFVVKSSLLMFIPLVEVFVMLVGVDPLLPFAGYEDGYV